MKVIKKFFFKIVVILGISVIATALVVAIGGKRIFTHYGTEIYTNWADFESVGYFINGQSVISTESDPHIYFYCPEEVYQIELDIQWNSFLERKEKDGSEYSNAQLFWADENGTFSEDNSKWIRLNYGRDSYVVNIDLPANTLVRIDVGEGKDVQFDVYGIMFKTYQAYTNREKVICILKMISMIFVAMFTGYLFCLRSKEIN